MIKKTYSEPPVALHEASCRVHRWRLQQALVKEVDQRRVCIGSKLVSALEIDGEKVRLLFEGGVTDEVDLVIGADGIRSVSLHNYQACSYFALFIKKPTARSKVRIPRLRY